MKKTIIGVLSAYLAVCMPAAAAASEDLDQAHYDVQLQPGKHVIIVQSPQRQIIQVDAKAQRTVTIEAAQNRPFVHLRIKPPVLKQPLDQVTAL